MPLRPLMNPARMSNESERALEWLNLVLATYCVGVAVFLWTTSPRPMRGDSTIVLACGSLLFVALPLLLVTSTILLFTNRRRAAIGFSAMLLSLIALSLSTAAFD